MHFVATLRQISHLAEVYAHKGEVFRMALSKDRTVRSMRSEARGEIATRGDASYQYALGRSALNGEGIDDHVAVVAREMKARFLGVRP